MGFELDRARQIYNLDPPGFENLVKLQAKGRGFVVVELLTIAWVTIETQ